MVRCVHICNEAASISPARREHVIIIMIISMFVVDVMIIVIVTILRRTALMRDLYSVLVSCHNRLLQVYIDGSGFLQTVSTALWEKTPRFRAWYCSGTLILTAKMMEKTDG